MRKNKDIVEKLNGHRLPIDESYWAEMEERLQPKCKKTVPFWLWFTGTGIAASLALLLTVRIFNTDNDNIGTQTARFEQISVDKTTTNDKHTNPGESTSSASPAGKENMDVQVMQIERIVADNIAPGRKPKNPQKSISVTEKENNSTRIARAGLIVADNNAASDRKDHNPDDSAQSALSSDKKNEKAANNNALTGNITTQTKQDTLSEKQDELQLSGYDDWLLAQNEPEFEKKKTQNKKSWQLAAAFSSSASNSSSSSFFLNNDLSTVNNEDKKGEEINPPTLVSKYPQGNKTDDPPVSNAFWQSSEITHLPPLSFGLSVRKNLNSYLAVETGLTYSFLQSEFEENSEWRHRDATQKLHYLGIPLNAVAYLLNKPKWNVYFSLGGMVEKGIMQDYVEHVTLLHPQPDESQSAYAVLFQEDIPGLQWSLNSSLGIGYRIYRDISIYFEPRIIYYFKNSQPMSARTETPLQVGLNAGLRFEF
jgi:hypothetical protein